MIEQHPSPQSSPEVNVTNNLKSEVEDHMTSGSQVISMNQSSGVEEEVDIPEPDEAEVGLNPLFTNGFFLLVLPGGVVSLTADPGVASTILVRSHSFVEIDHEIISTVILLPSA